MIWVVLRAVAAAALAGLILYQMRGMAELAFWEVLLLVVVVLQYREMPDRGDPLEVPLFRLPAPDPGRLPRAVATAELAVVDATSGYMSPDRRLLPTLRRIAQHRLDRQGIEIGSPEASEMLGEEAWKFLTGDGEGVAALDELTELVAELEKL